MSYYSARDRANLHYEAMLREQRERGLGNCRSCGAPVMWVVTSNGKPMPLDAAPTPTGNLRLTGRRLMERARPGKPRSDRAEAEYVETSSLFDAEPGEELYVSHFATCPDADEWRQRKAGGR